MIVGRYHTVEVSSEPQQPQPRLVAVVLHMEVKYTGSASMDWKLHFLLDNHYRSMFTLLSSISVGEVHTFPETNLFIFKSWSLFDFFDLVQNFLENIYFDQIQRQIIGANPMRGSTFFSSCKSRSEKFDLKKWKNGK